MNEEHKEFRKKIREIALAIPSLMMFDVQAGENMAIALDNFVDIYVSAVENNTSKN